MERNRKPAAGKGRHVLYLLAAAGMLFYGLTKLETGGAGQAFHLFWYVWLGFAALIIAANVNMLLVSEGKRKELERIKRAKALQWERRLKKRFASRESNMSKVRGR